MTGRQSCRPANCRDGSDALRLVDMECCDRFLTAPPEAIAGGRRDTPDHGHAGATHVTSASDDRTSSGRRRAPPPFAAASGSNPYMHAPRWSTGPGATRLSRRSVVRLGGAMPIDPSSDARFMRESLREAEAAAAVGEVPIGAVVVRDGVIIARGRNMPIATHDPTAHAEIVALRAAAAAIGNYRIADADLYVTVEPCVMCVGAIVHSRVRRVVFGCSDPKAGALGGAVDVTCQPGLNHRFIIQGGVCELEARALVQRFFRARRSRSVDGDPRP